MNKITAEQVMECEKNQLIEALGSVLELNNSFLARYCGDGVRALLEVIPEQDRGYALVIAERESYFNHSIPSNKGNVILLPVSEIEYQFQGEPAEVFENVEDWHIERDLAYLYIGYGLTIEYDLELLEQAVREILR